MTPSSTGFPAELSEELQDVLRRYSDAAKLQRASMLGSTMNVEIEARLTKLKEQGHMRLVQTINSEAESSLSGVVFTGDDRVRKEVIARYLTEEQNGKKFGAMNIAQQDYNYKIRAILKHNGDTMYVFDVEAKKRVAGQFRGELWLDGKTGMPVREAGQLVKSPNIFLTNLRFARDYELKDGVSVVKHFSSSAEIRLLGVGRAELDISYTNFTRAVAATGPVAVNFARL